MKSFKDVIRNLCDVYVFASGGVADTIRRDISRAFSSPFPRDVTSNNHFVGQRRIYFLIRMKEDQLEHQSGFRRYFNSRGLRFCLPFLFRTSISLVFC